MTLEKKSRASTRTEEVEETAPSTTEQSTAPEIDDILDEIDEVLEENAAEFVKSYVQKGGE